MGKVKKAEPASVADDDAELIEPILLEDAAVVTGPVQNLRDRYKELRAAYLALHKRHHERITDALAERKENSLKTGGDVPYGYRLDSDGETLIEDEAEQAVIVEAVRLRDVEELSYRKIAQALLRKKMRPRPVPKERRRFLKTKRFGEFDPTQVKRMIDAHKARAKFSD